MTSFRVDYVSTTDGDTFRAHLTGDPQPLTPGWGFQAVTIGEKGIPIRLITVDTPERGHPAFGTAATMLAGWVRSNQPAGLRVELFESAGWDRVLGDLWAGDRGNTASAFMLRNGWPPYRPGRVHGVDARWHG